MPVRHLKAYILGHINSSKGIELDPKNLQPILDDPAPSTVLEIKSWIGMVGHYSDFVPDLTTITEPLHQLQWNEEHLSGALIVSMHSIS